MAKEIEQVPSKDTPQTDDKNQFVYQLFKNQRLRKRVLEIIKRKGIMHSYRWPIWKLLQNYNKNCQVDQSLIEIRKQLYPLLLKCENEEVRIIVTKDVLRTSRQKILFQNMDSIGSQKLYNVCYALGCFFEDIGYIQGMNFVVGFVLEVSGLEEFDTFNFIVNFWKKQRTLYIGLYEENFPLMKFLQFTFHEILRKQKPKVEESLKKMQCPDELWIGKWFLSFFTFSLDKEFILRIFDFLMITDCLGMVYIALAITFQLEKVILKKDLSLFAATLANAKDLGKNIDFYKFVKKLKVMGVSNHEKLRILVKYYEY